ncbi:Mediator of DNA damage checkpoint protein 1 [Dissophora globulifera]|uniref:Mediator of DNA damage checkpoint protein 1 n=1 Tax=Dissophora globulifera TaxID=979702 RepID=A0A9P6RW40_9FUNG|nr:Mediator of DNA damage checkpoint protein 1 [Dissophora globulifera]
MDDEKSLPVALLCVHKFLGAETTMFPLYYGKNNVGFDARWSNVFLPWKRVVSRTHLTIEIGEDNRLFCCDPNKEPNTKIAGIKMEKDHHYEFLPERTELPVAKEIIKARMTMAAHVYENDGYPIDFTTVNISKLPSQDREQSPGQGDDATPQEVPTHRSDDDIRDGSAIPGEYDGQSTLLMGNLTMDRSLDSPSVPPRFQMPYPRNRQDDSFPGLPDSSFIVTSPTPTLNRDNSSESLKDSSPSLDQDGPTQLLDVDEAQRLVDDGSDLVDSQLDAANESVPETQLLQDATSFLEHPSNDVFRKEFDSSTGPVQEMVCETQSTQGDAQNTLPLRDSRPVSPEPSSQEISQVFSVPSSEQVFRPLVPATPAEVIGDSSHSNSNIESSEANVSNQTTGISFKQEVFDEDFKVPHTPEDKGFTPMITEPIVNVSVATGSRSDLLDGSLSSFSGSTESDSMQTPSRTDSHNSTRRQGDLGLGSGASTLTHEASNNSESNNEHIKSEEQWLSRSILTESQVLSTSVPRHENTPLRQADDNAYGSQEHPPSEASTLSPQGSPKHGLDSDTEENERQPTKHVKREPTVDPTFPPEIVRTASTSATRLLTRRSTAGLDSIKHMVMISAPLLLPKQKNEYEDIITECGGNVSSKAKDYKKATILVFKSKSMSRTTKLLCAIAQGLPIVSPEWLEECKLQKCFVPYEKYLVKESGMKDTYGISLEESCALGRANLQNGIKLFRDLAFYFVQRKGRGKKETLKLSEEGYITHDRLVQLEPLVEVCGGKTLKSKKLPETNKDKDKVIVVGPLKYCAETQQLIRNGYRAVKWEFMLHALLHQSADSTQFDIAPVELPATGGEMSAVEDLISCSETQDDNSIVSEDDDEDGSDDENDNDGDFEDSSKASSKGKGVIRKGTIRTLSRSVSAMSVAGSTRSRRGSEDSIVAGVAVQGSQSSTQKSTGKGSGRTAKGATTDHHDDGNESQEASSSTSAATGSKATKSGRRKKTMQVSATEDEDEVQSEVADEMSVDEAGSSSKPTVRPVIKATKPKKATKATTTKTTKTTKPAKASKSPAELSQSTADEATPKRKPTRK